VTRARRRLYLSFAQTRMLHGQTRYNLPSRFIEEIPGALIKWLTPRIGRHAAGGVSPRLTFVEEPRAAYAQRASGSSGWRRCTGLCRLHPT